MKRNGFITSLYSGIPPLPKPRGRPPKRLKEDEKKKKLDAAKREQINRFSKVTSPSGLLSGLNPGIINHVRNSKQVHAIIEAVVRSEKADSADKKERESKRMELSSNRLFSFKMKGPEKLEHDGLELKLTSENASSLCTEESPANAESVHYLSMKGKSLFVATALVFSKRLLTLMGLSSSSRHRCFSMAGASVSGYPGPSSR